MKLETALELFKSDIGLPEKELTQIYTFEKHLLEKKLSNPFDDRAELRESIDYSKHLDEAYALLIEQAKVQQPADTRDGKQKALFITTLIISVCLLVGAIYLLNIRKTQLDNQSIEALQAQESSNTGSKNTVYQVTPISSNKKESPATGQTPNAAANTQADKIKANAEKAYQDWIALVEGEKISLPSKILALKTKGDKLKSKGSISQSKYLYRDFIDQLSAHHKNVANYLDTFKKENELRTNWETLAKKERFIFAQLKSYDTQFIQVKKDLSDGVLPSYSRAALENTNVLIKITLERGQKIAKMRKQYYAQKSRWRSRVANNPFYKMTPAIRALMKRAETKTLYTTDFISLETEVFPRLLTHFKQTR